MRNNRLKSVPLNMTRRRFFAPPTAFDTTQNSVTLITDEARHLREVLRLKPGDEVYVFDGAGKEFLSRIEESRRDTARLEIIREVEPARPESKLQLTLALALLDNWENERAKFVKVFPNEYKRALSEMFAKRATVRSAEVKARQVA